MEQAKGEVKHVLLAKFKDGVTHEEIIEHMKGFVNLVNLIEPLKAFHWGTNVSIENLNQGFTHIFVCSFENTEGIAQFIAHPAHDEFDKYFEPTLDKVLVFDYKPTIVRF